MAPQCMIGKAGGVRGVRVRGPPYFMDVPSSEIQRLGNHQYLVYKCLLPEKLSLATRHRIWPQKLCLSSHVATILLAIRKNTWKKGSA